MADFDSLANFIDGGGEEDENNSVSIDLGTEDVAVPDSAATFIESFGEETTATALDIPDNSQGEGIDPFGELMGLGAPEEEVVAAEPDGVTTMLPTAYDPEAPIQEPQTVETEAVPEFSVDDLDDDQVQMLPDLIRDMVNEESTSMRGLDPMSRTLLLGAAEMGPDASKKLMQFGEVLGAVGEWTEESLGSILSVMKTDTFAAPIYDVLNKVVAGGRYAEAENPEELASRLMGVAGTASEFAETVPALGGLLATTRMVQTDGGIAGSVKKLTKQERKLAEARRNSFENAEFATMQQMEEARQRAAEAAKANDDIAQALITQFEEKTGKTVSTEVDGRRVLDPELARQAGRETMQDMEDDSVAGLFSQLNVPENEALQPILKPEKFDGIVAIASDLKKRNPDLWDDNKTVIDNLFNLTVTKELDGTELLDDLNKYGLSFEDYVLTVVGSGSDAGKVLNKLSQIKRARPKGDAAAAAERELLDQQGAIRKGVMRLENIRRGLLVSQLATAARNLTSGAVRAPLESLGNVMDTALLKLSDDGVGAAGKALVSGQNWRDSFRSLKYMFSRPDVAKGYTDLILKQPELEGQYNRMFNNINEIHQMTGRGQGGTVDGVLSRLEDATDVMNIPNRWQEFLIRRGAFFGELERQVRNEYDADLIDLLQQGKLRDLINGASTAVPEGKANFMDLVDRSVTSAMDVTFAKQPDVPVFRSTAQFIVRNGLTTVMPFPRFMFNSMELMGQYAAGASIPLTRKVASLVTGGKVGKGSLTAKDRQRISRNLTGMAAVGAAYMYRTSDEAPADYNMVSVDDETQMDTTAQYPVPQFMYLGEATKRMNDGTFDDWFDAKEFVKLFAGTNLRAGVGNSILEEVSEMADATDLTKGEAIGRFAGRTLGNYLSTWAVPLSQVIEAERALGVRGTEYKDMAQDPTFDMQETFMSELSRPFKQRGIGVSAEEEAAAPSREFLFADSKSRVSPTSRLFLGLNLSTKDAEYGEYLSNLGFKDYLLGSRSKVASIKRFENATLREFIPTVVEIAQKREDRLRKLYKDKPESFRDQFTEEEYVNNNIRPFISENVRKIKSQISEGSIAVGDDYTRAMVQYRRITPEYRKQATTDFADRYGRMPDPTSAQDLQKLIVIGRAYRKAYR